MKKRLKKLLALGLATVMTLGIMTGCGSEPAASNESSASGNETESTASSDGQETENTEDAGEIDISEHLNLTMYLLGDRTEDFDKVYDKINEILEEKLNCSIEVKFLSWGEHNDKYSLLFTSGDDFDLIFTASGWAHYEQTAALNGFYEMTEEFIQTYAPGIWDVVPETAWEQTKINGKIYMVPNYQNEFGVKVIAARGDLMDKYGYETLNSWEELSSFFMDVATKEDGVYACQDEAWNMYFQCMGFDVIKGAPSSLFMYNAQDPDDLKAYYMPDWDGFVQYCKQAKELADAGAWSRDVLNSTDERQTGLLNGRTATMMWTLDTCAGYADQANNEHPGWNVIVCDPAIGLPKKVNPYTNNGVAININSKNPERAMMVLNEFYTNPDIYDLAMLGIEGVHWEAVGDDQYKIIDESGYGVSNNCNWGWTNENLTRTEYIENPTALDEISDSLTKAWAANIKAPHAYDTFSFNTENVTTEIAAVSSVVEIYYTPLTVGLVDDVDAAIAEMKDKLEAAGVGEILEELNRQLEEYVASQG